MLSLTGWRFHCLMASLWFDRQLVVCLSMPRPDPDDPLEEIDLTFIRSRGKNPFVLRMIRSEDLTVSQLVSSCDHTLTAPSLTLPIPSSFYPSFPTKGLFIHCYWSKLFLPLSLCNRSTYIARIQFFYFFTSGRDGIILLVIQEYRLASLVFPPSLHEIDRPTHVWLFSLGWRWECQSTSFSSD